MWVRRERIKEQWRRSDGEKDGENSRDLIEKKKKKGRGCPL